MKHQYPGPSGQPPSRACRCFPPAPAPYFSNASGIPIAALCSAVVAADAYCGTSARTNAAMVMPPLDTGFQFTSDTRTNIRVCAGAGAGAGAGVGAGAGAGAGGCGCGCGCVGACQLSSSPSYPHPDCSVSTSEKNACERGLGERQEIRDQIKQIKLARVLGSTTMTRYYHKALRRHHLLGARIHQHDAQFPTPATPGTQVQL